MVLQSSADVYRTAALLVEEFGEFAPASAFIRADQFSDAGNVTACEMWRQIAKVAETLLTEERPADAEIH